MQEAMTYPEVLQDKYAWHKGFFQKTMSSKDVWVRNYNELYQRDLALMTCGNVEGKNILDIGCGQGMYVLTFLKMGAKQVAGIDILSEYIEIAKGYVKENGFEADLQTASCTELPFSENSFDILFSGDVFEHITLQQKEACVHEAFRVLKPGGVFVIKTPNLKYLKLTLFLKRVAGLFRFRNPFNIHIAHTKDNPDCEHHGLTTHGELQDIFVKYHFHTPTITYCPLNRGKFPKWLAKVLRMNLFFNESIILSSRKPLFLGLYP